MVTKNLLQQKRIKRFGLLIFHVFVFFLLGFTYQANGQTKGLIVKRPTVTANRQIMDPNLDGYVSATASGFVSNDVAESEIPYRRLPFPGSEPMSDLASGASRGHTDLADNGNIYPISTYTMPINNAAYSPAVDTMLMFRFRLGNISKATAGYSILIDTDGKFGNTGTNADPTYTTTNPGFEVEVVLATNFGVRLYNVDAPAGIGTILTELAYDNYSQKAIAYTTNDGTPDYFYDFYIPFSVIKTYISSYKANTAVRMVGNTVLGSRSALTGPISDVGGINDQNYVTSNTLNTLSVWSYVVDRTVPASTNTTTTSELPPTRSEIPTVTGTIRTSNTSISGTSSEANGTTIKVYKNGVLLGTTTVSAGAWTLSSGVSGQLAIGDIITATATASGESESSASAGVVVVAALSGCATLTVPNISCSSDKGFLGTVAGAASGTIVNFYLVGGSATTPVATVTTGSNGQAASGFLYKCNGNYSGCSSGAGCVGTTIGSGSYYARTQDASGCLSDRSNYVCIGGTATTATPTGVTDPITTQTTTVSGSAAAGSTVSIVVNGNRIGIVTLGASQTAWTISGLGFEEGQIANIQSVSGTLCVSTSVTRTVILPRAAAPVVTSPIRVGASTISGTSTEADGAVIKVIIFNGTTTDSSRTTTVSGGNWSITGLASSVLPNTSSTVRAKAIATGESISPVSNTVTVSAAAPAVPAVPNITGTYVEGGLSVSGTGPVSTTINLYADGLFIKSTTSNASGAWTVSWTANEFGTGSGSYILSTGVQLTATSGTIGTNESAKSNSTLSPDNRVFVQCSPSIPSQTLTITPATAAICSGSTQQFQIAGSETGVVYTLRNSTNTADLSTSVIGTGSTITLTSFALTNATTSPVNQTILIKADRTEDPSCGSKTMNTQPVVTINPIPTTSLTLSGLFTIRQNESTTISVANTQNGHSYRLYNTANNALVGSAVVSASEGSTVNLGTGNLTETTIFGVTVTDLTRSTNCSANLTNFATIEVLEPLPVELISFQADVYPKRVKLYWTTASERNNAYFLIERSTDAQNFTVIGKVNGSGNTYTNVNYTFDDEHLPKNGELYYRLKQVDFDGSYKYSSLINVSALQEARLSVYPNPVQEILNINCTTLKACTLQISIKDVTGRSVHEQAINCVAGTNLLNINTAGIKQKGLYFLQVKSTELNHIMKLTKK